MAFPASEIGPLPWPVFDWRGIVISKWRTISGTRSSKGMLEGMPNRLATSRVTSGDKLLTSSRTMVE